MTSDKNTRLKWQNHNDYSYLFFSSYLKILLPNQGLLHYMKTWIYFFFKKTEQHEITIGQTKKEKRL